MNDDESSSGIHSESMANTNGKEQIKNDRNRKISLDILQTSSGGFISMSSVGGPAGTTSSSLQRQRWLMSSSTSPNVSSWWHHLGLDSQFKWVHKLSAQLEHVYLDASYAMWAWIGSLLAIFAVCFGLSALIVYSSSSYAEGRDRLHLFYMRLFIQLTCLNLSIAAGVLVLILFMCTPRYRSFVFPGVLGLMAAHLGMHFTRLIQVMGNVTVIYPHLCKYFLTIFFFFKPAGIFCIAVIAIYMILYVDVTSTQVSHRHFHHITYIVVAMAALAHTIAVSYPYYDLEHPKEFVDATSRSRRSVGVCFGDHLFVLSNGIVPLGALILSVVAIIMFRRKVLVLYPRSAKQRICTRVWRYLAAFIGCCIVVQLLYLLRNYVVNPYVVSSHPEFEKLSGAIATIELILHDLEGFVYAVISLHDFVQCMKRYNATGHCQDMEMAEMEFVHVVREADDGSKVHLCRWGQVCVAAHVFKLQQINMEKMKRGALVASTLSHPSILRTYGCGMVDDSHMALVTEFVEGGSLEDVILSGTLEYKTLLRYAKHIANGMNYLHSLDPPIIHGALKPSVCLLSVAKDSIKIADAGCVQWVIGLASTSRASVGIGGHTPPRNSTRNGRLGQTDCWSPPEVIMDPKYAKNSPKVDVYSFAIMIWQLHCGRLPFEEVNWHTNSLERAIVTGYRPKIPPSCPAFLRELIQCCWHPLPSHRPNFSTICRLLQNEFDLILYMDRTSRSNDSVCHVEAKYSLRPVKHLGH